MVLKTTFFGETIFRYKTFIVSKSRTNNESYLFTDHIRSKVMDRLNRKWMYERCEGHLLRKEFVDGVKEFVEFAKARTDFINSSQIRCPCAKCKNRKFLGIDGVREHLYKKGFVNDYFEWAVENNGVLPNAADVYERTHSVTIDGESSVPSNKAKQTLAVYNETSEDYKKNGVRNEPDDVFLEVIGGKKKGNVYGLGNAVLMFYKPNNSPESNESTYALL